MARPIKRLETAGSGRSGSQLRTSVAFANLLGA